jgi:hypothetical protein
LAVHEVIAVDTALFALLTVDNDPPTTPYVVYAGIAPDDVEPPFILFALQFGNDVAGAGDPAARILTTFRYVIRAFGKGPSFVGIASMADYIDAQVHNANATSGDGRAIRFRRLGPIAQREPNDGDWWVSLGGLYEVTMAGP